MADVIADLMDGVDEALEYAEEEGHSLGLLDFVVRLRAIAERGGIVTLQMPAPMARLLAAYLEELALLRAVPPTGEEG